MQLRPDRLAGPRPFAVGRSCIPEETFFAGSGIERVQDKLKANYSLPFKPPPSRKEHSCNSSI